MESRTKPAARIDGTPIDGEPLLPIDTKGWLDSHDGGSPTQSTGLCMSRGLFSEGGSTAYFRAQETARLVLQYRR